MLDEIGIAHECRAFSAYRHPAQACEYASTAAEWGVEVLIAAAGGATHLVGVIAAHAVSAKSVSTDERLVTERTRFPVINRTDASWHSGATIAIGKAGAVNAALFTMSLLAATRPELREKIKQYRNSQAERILKTKLE